MSFVDDMNDDSYSGRRVLVTGGAGFIGSHLVEELTRRDAAVTVIDRVALAESPLAELADRLRYRRLDLRRRRPDPVVRESRPDLVFHLASNAYVPPSVEDPRADLEINAVATFDLLEAVRRRSPETGIVVTSSAAVYGRGSDRPIREEFPTVPMSPYGISKLAAERYAAVYADLYGLRTAALRLFPVYGPRNRKQVVFDLISKLHDDPDRLPIHGDGSQVRDNTYVADTVRAFLLVGAAAPLEGEVYNVGSGDPVTIAELARTICDRMGVSPTFEYSGDVRPGDAEAWIADLSRIEALGYGARVPLSAGIDATLDWFRGAVVDAG